MPRIRTVKPEYPKHKKVRQVERDARLLNIHLWNLADDEGRLQELPQWIIGEVFPTDEDVTPVVLREWLGRLHDAGLISRYEVDGERYIQCHDFKDHQVINKPRPSDIPPPDAENTDSRTPTVVLPDDSHPEQGTGNREMEQGEEVSDDTSVELALDGPADLREVFEYWCTVTGRPKAKWTDDKRKALAARKREGFDIEELKRGVDGSQTPGAVDAKTDHRYDDFLNIFRNARNLEANIERAEKAQPDTKDFVASLNARHG